MAVTFKDMINQTADFIKFDLEDDDDNEVENRIKSGLNEGKNVLAQRFSMSASESVTLDADACFDSEALSKPFCGLVRVLFNGAEAETAQTAGLIRCAAPANASVTVEYAYIPDDMVNDADVFPFPAAVPWRLLCYYAAMRYYEIKGTNTSLVKYKYWSGEFESGANMLRGGNKALRRRIKAVYDY